ncbi:unnamed protein product [Rotaria magnacalcarata]|uniref:Uncharacterized protein n=1 Tax=Rotaria magnacalcarata TaxID=392030 RepID=A0A815BPR0_9BILA|nr:unnamed protein product [Rotaria magnacalcarata]CAF1598892.1 unnamed protein product [Rotaria magnacalcarata]CAF2145064.1 unnamed protein product [Rotaria magnacalcarata]CAF3770495.1 unnamed protein product [Rotaria magnacalcarata]CAF3803472.1 unnamed protein product [Rotaria magnacalcarata]
MKSMLAALVFYSFTNFVLANEEFNLQSGQEQIINSSSINESALNLQKFKDHEQTDFNDSNIIADPHEITKNDDSEVNYFLNRVINPKFRHMMHTHGTNAIQSSSVSIQSNQSLLDDESKILSTTISSLIIQTLTQELADNYDRSRRRLSFVDYYYQKIKTLLKRRQENWTRRPYSNIKTGL